MNYLLEGFREGKKKKKKKKSKSPFKLSSKKKGKSKNPFGFFNKKKKKSVDKKYGNLSQESTKRNDLAKGYYGDNVIVVYNKNLDNAATDMIDAIDESYQYGDPQKKIEMENEVKKIQTAFAEEKNALQDTLRELENSINSCEIDKLSLEDLIQKLRLKNTNLKFTNNQLVEELTKTRKLARILDNWHKVHHPKGSHDHSDIGYDLNTIPQGLENLGIDANDSDFTNALTQLTDEDRVRFTRNVLSNMSDNNVDNVLNNLSEDTQNIFSQFRNSTDFGGPINDGAAALNKGTSSINKGASALNSESEAIAKKMRKKNKKNRKRNRGFGKGFGRGFGRGLGNMFGFTGVREGLNKGCHQESPLGYNCIPDYRGPVDINEERVLKKYINIFNPSNSSYDYSLLNQFANQCGGINYAGDNSDSSLNVIYNWAKTIGTDATWDAVCNADGATTGYADETRAIKDIGIKNFTTNQYRNEGDPDFFIKKYYTDTEYDTFGQFLGPDLSNVYMMNYGLRFANGISNEEALDGEVDSLFLANPNDGTSDYVGFGASYVDNGRKIDPDIIDSSINTGCYGYRAFPEDDDDTFDASFAVDFSSVCLLDYMNVHLEQYQRYLCDKLPSDVNFTTPENIARCRNLKNSKWNWTPDEKYIENKNISYKSFNQWSEDLNSETKFLQNKKDTKKPYFNKRFEVLLLIIGILLILYLVKKY